MPALTFLLWLALVLGAGWAAFPLAHRAFSANASPADLPDAGLAVGRILFLTVCTMLAFWLGQFGVAVAWSAWLYAPLALVGIGVGWRDREQLRASWPRLKRAIVASEVVFLTVFLGFFLLRGFWSDTNGSNGEKSMDSALIGTLVRAEQLPPANPYSAGARLSSYYYLGPLQTALLTRASGPIGTNGTSVRWSYNLMCATLPALCVAGLFSLGAALTGSQRGGAWVAGAVLAGGTLQPIYQWTHPDIYSASRFLGLDAFAISRVIPFTINEFPWFTFHQGDLHGHYFSFPLQIALMSLGWSLLRAKRLAIIGLSALVLGAIILTNTWDFPAFALLSGLSIVVLRDDAAPAENRRAAQMRALLQLAPRAAWALGMVAVALLLAAPFLLGLRSAANPPQWLPQPASSLREWLLMWGPIALGWWVFSAYAAFKESLIWRAAIAAMIVGVGVAAAFNAWQTPSILVLPIIAASAGFAIAGAINLRGAERYLCVLALCGLVALGWSETTWAGFLGSAENPGVDDYKRQDTVFKFGLQVWMLWGAASAAGLWLVVTRGSRRLRGGALAVIVPVALVMVAGNLAFLLYRVRFGVMVNAQSAGQADWFQFDAWDGWAHLAPPEKAAARWLLDNARAGENILEAEKREGGDFSEFTRYTTVTGIPTIIGPLAHSYYWAPSGEPMGRGKAGREAKGAAEWADIYQRKADVQRIYSPMDNAERVRMLQRYGVKYLIWGELERREYGEDHFADVMSLPVVAQFGDGDDPHRVTIFRVD